jgi:dihydrofolate synthase/folylpolyglutamate synthase
MGVSPAGIANTAWPGRLEQVSTTPEIILDGAHNPAGVRALVHYIDGFYADRKIWLIYGVMRDKEVAEMARMLFPLAHRVILTAPANSRAMPPELIPAPGAAISYTVAEAVALATWEAQTDPRAVVFVTGSLFVVGEARALLVQ